MKNATCNIPLARFIVMIWTGIRAELHECPFFVRIRIRYLSVGYDSKLHNSLKSFCCRILSNTEKVKMMLIQVVFLH